MIDQSEIDLVASEVSLANPSLGEIDIELQQAVFANASSIGIRLNEHLEQEILEGFSPEQQAKILQEKAVLSSTTFFIGKDLEMPVRLNIPGGGWYWDTEKNEVRVDPKDLLERERGTNRFVFAHEGAHRRISRVGVVDDDLRQNKAFWMILNSIEDPRVNNFLLEAYPALSQDMTSRYLNSERSSEDTANLIANSTKRVPDTFKIGLEYIKRWFQETAEVDLTASDSALNKYPLPEHLEKLVDQTQDAARTAWLLYPTKSEANESQDTINAFARASFEQIRDNVWPVLKKAVEWDMELQAAQELLNALAAEKKKLESGELPEKDPLFIDDQLLISRTEKHLTAEQAGELKTALSCKEETLLIDNLSPELQEGLLKALKSIVIEAQKELYRRAEEAIATLNKLLAPLVPEEESERQQNAIASVPPTKIVSQQPPKNGGNTSKAGDDEDVANAHSGLINGRDNYNQQRRTLIPAINELEDELRQILHVRKQESWETGKRSGQSFDVKRRISEVAQGKSQFESRAFRTKEFPTARDYVFSLLVDISGSMDEGSKSEQAMCAAITFSEVLGRLGVKSEILFFNDSIREVKKLHQRFSPEIREQIGNITNIVDGGTRDGYALAHAADHLTKAREKEKFIVILTDSGSEGNWEEPHEFSLSNVVSRITRETDINLVAIGVGPGTEGVVKNYPHAIYCPDVSKLPMHTAKLLRAAIAGK